MSRVTRKNSDNQTDIPLTISSKDGLINQNEFFSKQVASKDMSGYYLLQKGEFAYNKSYSVGFDFGSIKRLEKYDQGALSTLYICFALNRFDSDFIKHYFDSLKWYREIYMISAEGARNHGLLNVPTEDFFATLHTLPMDTAEQKKIANFLDLLTAKIEKQQALVDNLKKYKRGAIQAIFEQKMHFISSKSWDCDNLGSIFFERNERSKGDEELLAVTIQNGVQKRSEIDLKDNSSEDKSNYKRVLVGDIAYNTMRMWQGASGGSSYSGIVSPAYTVISPIDPQRHNYRFWAYYFKHTPLVQTFQKYSQGLTSDTWNLKFPQLSEIQVNYPSRKEQDLIVAFLEMLDEKCYTEEKLLSALIKTKRQLLSDMFI